MPRIVYTDISGQERSVPFGADHPIVTIGRGTDCTIRSNRKSVSRRHAEFRFTNGQFEIIDLNSSNGTFLIINDERKPVNGREYLAPNDEVWCGDFILHFIDEEDANTAATADPFGIHDDFTADGKVDLDFGAMDEIAAWGGTQPPQPIAPAGPDHTMERSNDLERLLAEKRSIEDLAARQADELEELQKRLDDARRQLDQKPAYEDRDPDHTSMVPPPMAGEVEQLRDKIARLQDEADDLEAEARQSRAEAQKLNDELISVRDEKRRLEEKLHDTLQNQSKSSDAEGKLGEAQRRIQSLEAELEASIARTQELESHLNENADALEMQQKLHEDLLARDRDIETLESEIVRLQSETKTLNAELQEARTTSATGQQAIEETDALRRELDRHRRLIEEFERRNRDLQVDVDDLRAAHRDDLEKITQANTRIATLEEEVQNARTEADTHKSSAEELKASLEELQSDGSVDDLRREIEGLRQRLRLEKERTRHDEQLAADHNALKAQFSEVQSRYDELLGEFEVLKESLGSEPSAAQVDGVPAELQRQLLDRIDSLERIVDAIERTNLDALSTVDRVRLQSAIRETEPKKSLEHLKTLLGAESD